MTGWSEPEEGYHAGVNAYYARWVNQAGTLHIKDIRVVFISTTKLFAFFFALKFVFLLVCEFSSYRIPFVIRSSFLVQYRKEFKYNDKWQPDLDVEECGGDCGKLESEHPV